MDFVFVFNSIFFFLNDYFISSVQTETLVTIVCQNTTTNEIEAELVFPLQEKDLVCGYSVDINGELVEAVAVQKDEAR